MATAIFGYQNLLFSDGVTLTPSSEAAGHPADNLKRPHPSSLWRATTISAAFDLDITFPTPSYIGLVAALYTNATPYTNLIPYSEDLTESSAWTDNRVATASLSGAAINASPHPASIFKITPDGSNDTHYLAVLFDRLNRQGLTTQGYKLTVSFWVGQDTSSGAHCRVTLYNDPSGTPAVVGAVNINLTSGTIVSTTVDVESAQIVETVNLDLYTLYRVEAVYDVSNSYNDEDWEMRVYALDNSLNTVHTSTDAIIVAGPMVDPATDSARAYAPTAGAATGSMWECPVGFSGVLLSHPESLPLYSTEIGFQAAVGWIHGYQSVSTLAAWDSVTLTFFDPNNADGYFDLSNLYIGPSFQPSLNRREDLHVEVLANPLVSRAAGGQEFRGAIAPSRMWRLRFDRQTRADISEWQAMRLLVGSSVPVVCILNPDEAVYGQEEVMYGTIEELSIRERGYRLSVGESLWDVEITLQEVVK